MDSDRTEQDRTWLSQQSNQFGQYHASVRYAFNCLRSQSIPKVVIPDYLRRCLSPTQTDHIQLHLKIHPTERKATERRTGTEGKVRQGKARQGKAKAKLGQTPLYPKRSLSTPSSVSSAIKQETSLLMLHASRHRNISPSHPINVRKTAPTRVRLPVHSSNQRPQTNYAACLGIYMGTR